jgi:hypothetical protein
MLMKLILNAVAIAGLLTLGACNRGDSAAENKAENIEAVGENVAESYENKADMYENKADMVRDNASNAADAVTDNAAAGNAAH